MKSTQTVTATDAYFSAQATAADLLAAIAEAIEDHQDNTPYDRVDWGHVGDLGYVNAQLSEALAFLSGYQSMQQK